MTSTTSFARRGVLPILLATTALMAASPALAQVPGIGEAVQQSEQTRQAAPALRSPGALVLPRLAEPQLVLKDKETLFIKRFEIAGDGPIDVAEILPLLEPYQNRKLNILQIYEAADVVTNLYRGRGYILAKAYVPAQNAKTGVLRLKIVPGKYGARTINNDSLVRESFLKGIIDSALGTSPYIRQDSLERAMLLVSDLNGAGMPRVVTGAGRQPETSDFAFNVPPERRVDGYLTADNWGSPYTGRNRLTGGVNLNSPLGFGDKLSGFGIFTEHGDLKNGRVSYAFPVGTSGLKAELAAFRTTYALGSIYNVLDATGNADAVSATLLAPIKRQREESWYLSGNFTHKSLTDKIMGDPTDQRDMDVGMLAAQRDSAGTFIGLPLVTSTTASVSYGSVGFSDADMRALHPAIAAHFVKANVAFTSTLGLTERLSLAVNVKAQKSFSGNLDSSEQMFLTGAYGVRSFDEGIAGDSGYLVQPEFKYALPAFPNYQHSLGLFTDVGAAKIENPVYVTTQNPVTYLNDVGAGYYASYEYSPERTLLFRAHLAHSYGGTGGAAIFYNRGTKALFQTGFTF